MAGIGFRLKAVLAEDTYLAAIKSYLYAAIISSGPWIISVVALAFLGVASSGFLPNEARDLFFVTVVYTYALSMMSTGWLQMIVTRYLSDRFYLRDDRAIAPTFVSALVLTLAIQVATIAPLWLLADLPWFYRCAAIALYAAASGIWMVMLFLSAAKDYQAIILSFGVGYGSSVLLAIALGPPFGILGYLGGFTAGQVLTLALLAGRVFAEFPLVESWSFAWLGHFRRYPSLAGIGLLYNLAVWGDKVLFWFSPEGMVIQGTFRVFPTYDSPMFLAYLTTAPALAIFLINVETAFYDAYRAFFQAIAAKKSLAEIVRQKEAMIAALQASLLTILKVQSTIAFLAIVFAPDIFRLVGAPPSQVSIFRVAILAVAVQVFLLILILILLYLDLRGSVLLVSLVYLGANLALTAVTVGLGYPFYGFGYLYATLLATLLAYLLLARTFRRLEYLTFSRQPIS